MNFKNLQVGTDYCGTIRGPVLEVKADPSPLQRQPLLKTSFNDKVTLYFDWQSAQGAVECRRYVWKKQRVAAAVPAISLSFRYHFLQPARPSCLVPCTARPLGTLLVDTFQQRSLKLDFQGVAAALMLPSLGGNKTNLPFWLCLRFCQLSQSSWPNVYILNLMWFDKQWVRKALATLE